MEKTNKGGGGPFNCNGSYIGPVNHECPDCPERDQHYPEGDTVVYMRRADSTNMFAFTDFESELKNDEGLENRCIRMGKIRGRGGRYGSGYLTKQIKRSAESRKIFASGYIYLIGEDIVPEELVGRTAKEALEKYYKLAKEVTKAKLKRIEEEHERWKKELWNKEILDILHSPLVHGAAKEIKKILSAKLVK